ncbi:MAG TPA: DMT family transporter [Streptosporangiaceae bacterium]|nr:DMT family transporter [Streptosporangiaceae bacterium]
MRIAIALVAALLIGTGLVLQQHAAEQAPKAHFLRVSLVADLFRKPRWLLGIAVMGVGEVLAAWTLGNLSLSVAEPLLATQLIFALVVAVPLSGERLRKSEILGAVLLSAGVGALSAARSVNAEGMRFGSAAYWPAAAAIGFLALVLVRAGLRRTGQQRATLTGLAAGLCFGISDALTRNTLLIVEHHGVTAVLTTWPAYSLAVAALAAVWLMENSFSAAPLHASLPAITAAEPVVGILLGVVVFGDAIRISPPMLALQAAGIVALVGGVILVARAPALSSLRAPVLRRGTTSRAEAHPGPPPTTPSPAPAPGSDPAPTPGPAPSPGPAPGPGQAAGLGRAAGLAGSWGTRLLPSTLIDRQRGKTAVPQSEPPDPAGPADLPGLRHQRGQPDLELLAGARTTSPRTTVAGPGPAGRIVTGYCGIARKC